MKSNIFITSAFISLIYLIAKFFEMRFIEKESKPFKFLLRDTLLVYFSVIISHFIMEQLNPIMSGGAKITPVFVDNPGF